MLFRSIADFFYLRVSDIKKICDWAGGLFIGVYLDLAYLGSILRPALFVSYAIVLLPPSVVVKEKIAANRLFRMFRLTCVYLGLFS